MKKFLTAAAALVFLFACAEKKAENKTPEDYLVKMKGAVITEADLNKELKSLPEPYRQLIAMQGGSGMLIEEMLKKELLYMEAMKKGIDKKEAYKKQLEELKKRALVQLLLEDEIENKAAVTDEEARDYYNKNKKDFTVEDKDKKQSKTVEFDKVKDLLKQRLSQKKQQQAFESYIQNLKKEYAVEMNEEAIGKLGASAEKPSGAKPTGEKPKGHP
jgi:peptidyl-prolyl cis-trans isomerase C